jgi:hypothetical protein
MDFPYEYAEKTLDYFAAQGIDRFSTCVEGEATLYKHWYEVFSEFHDKYPHIKLRMTTNLNREFSDKEIELLTKYRILDVSVDTLNAELNKKIRVNANLELLLKNLDKISIKVKELGIKGPYINLHSVVSTMTWRYQEELADYAFARGYDIEMGDFEVRANTVAFKEKLLFPISTMPLEEQQMAYNAIKRIKEKAEKLKCKYEIQGNIFSKIAVEVNQNYNRFKPYNNNPVINAFYKKYPKGLKGMYLDILYDFEK